MTYKQLIIMGCGGHARSIANVALATGYKSLVFVDENARAEETLLGFPVFTNFTPSEPDTWFAFAASGNGQSREAQTQIIRKNGWRATSLVAPSATLEIGCSVDEFVFVGHHAYIGPMAMVGKGSIVNTGAIVEHECLVGKWAHVSVNATMAGRSSLGDFSMLGAGATMIDAVAVTSKVTIGAGAVVIRSIDESGVYIGVPAAKLAK